MVVVVVWFFLPIIEPPQIYPDPAVPHPIHSFVAVASQHHKKNTEQCPPVRLLSISNKLTNVLNALLKRSPPHPP